MRKRRPRSARNRSDSSIWKRLRHNRYFWMASGFFGCLLAAGILAVVLNYIIQPLSTPETWGTVTMRETNLSLWYAEDSTSLEDHVRIAAELERTFADLISFLDIDKTTLPLPIDVFIHDSVPAMQGSIARRKSRSASTYFNSPVDIIDGKPVRPPLAEVLLSQGWGSCFTQAVYLGTLLYVSSPETDFLCTVSSAPVEMRHSVQELIQMESEGRYPKTAYQQLGDPSAPRALLSLEDWHMLYFASDTMASLAIEDFPRTELASLIQYVAETSGSLAPLKAAWGPGLRRRSCSDAPRSPCRSLIPRGNRGSPSKRMQNARPLRCESASCTKPGTSRTLSNRSRPGLPDPTSLPKTACWPRIVLSRRANSLKRRRGPSNSKDQTVPRWKASSRASRDGDETSPPNSSS